MQLPGMKVGVESQTLNHWLKIWGYKVCWDTVEEWCVVKGANPGAVLSTRWELPLARL